MIKKTTKVVFLDNDLSNSGELIGGIPLSAGEIINFHKGNQAMEYKVVDKKVDCFMDGEDQRVDIVYMVEKVTK